MGWIRDRWRRIRFFLKGEPPLVNTEIDADLLRRVVGVKSPRILEIGCNDGSSTLWFFEVFDQPTVHCFEPDPRAIERFRAKVKDTPNVHLHELALSDRNGEATFHMSDGGATDEMPEGHDQSGSLHKPKRHLEKHPWCKFERTIAVKTMTLDSWCQQQGIDAPDFIWMDVQGAELDVISGGSDTLRSVRALYTEYNNTELYEGQPHVRKLLKHLPLFETVRRFPSDVLLRNKTLGAPDEN